MLSLKNSLFCKKICFEKKIMEHIIPSLKCLLWEREYLFCQQPQLHLNHDHDLQIHTFQIMKKWEEEEEKEKEKTIRKVIKKKQKEENHVVANLLKKMGGFNIQNIFV